VNLKHEDAAYSPGSVLRPVLKRSESVGLIGMRSVSQEMPPNP
jgi:hypothetical protein